MRMAGSGNVSWERFEEQTKLAFVGNPLNSRFFLKTRVTATKGVKVVARVSHHSTKPTMTSAGGRNEAIKYATSDTTNLFRLMKLLHFVMQEALRPMKALRASTSTPVSPTTKPATTPAPASQAVKKKKLKKKKKATKSLS